LKEEEIPETISSVGSRLMFTSLFPINFEKYCRGKIFVESYGQITVVERPCPLPLNCPQGRLSLAVGLCYNFSNIFALHFKAVNLKGEL
jgi:hypothetical protein